MTDWAYAGLSFRVNANFHADDTGNDFTRMNCYAQFTAVDFDSDTYDGTSYSSTSTTAATVGVVGLLGLGAYAGFKERKRRLQSPAIDLQDEDPSCPYDESTTVAFEIMGGEADSVRV
jgi:hypothetical protein